MSTSFQDSIFKIVSLQNAVIVAKRALHGNVISNIQINADQQKKKINLIKKTKIVFIFEKMRLVKVAICVNISSFQCSYGDGTFTLVYILDLHVITLASLNTFIKKDIIG